MEHISVILQTSSYLLCDLFVCIKDEYVYHYYVHKIRSFCVQLGIDSDYFSPRWL